MCDSPSVVKSAITFGTLVYQAVLSQGTLTLILQEVLMIRKSHLLMLSMSQGVPYIAFERDTENSNPCDLKAYGRPRVI